MFKKSPNTYLHNPRLAQACSSLFVGSGVDPEHRVFLLPEQPLLLGMALGCGQGQEALVTYACMYHRLGRWCPGRACRLCDLPELLPHVDCWSWEIYVGKGSVIE